MTTKGGGNTPFDSKDKVTERSRVDLLHGKVAGSRQQRWVKGKVYGVYKEIGDIGWTSLAEQVRQGYRASCAVGCVEPDDFGAAGRKCLFQLAECCHW